MIDKNIVAVRISEIKEAVKLLKPIINISSREFANDPDQYLKAERLLEIIIQSILDIGTHILAAKSLKKAEDYHQVIDITAQDGVYPKELLGRIHKMIGLRNILAHEYLEIDRERLHNDIKDGINDYSIICKSIVEYLEKQ